jgi:hypothetical protein
MPSHPRKKHKNRAVNHSLFPTDAAITGLTATPHFTQTAALSFISAPQFVQNMIHPPFAVYSCSESLL